MAMAMPVPGIKAERDHALDWIKWLALVAMVLDHIWFILPAEWQDPGYGLRVAGRLAFPLFCLAIAANMTMITDEQFDALAELLRLQNGVRREAARLVLVEGLRPADAARQAGTTPQTVNSALVSCRRGIALAQIVAGTSDH